MRRWLACLFLVLAAGVQADEPPGRPAPQPTFRAGVGLVQVPVIVRDAEDQPVRGLPDEAFDVFENGRRMALLDVEEIRRDARPDPAPRRIIMVVDDLNIRPQMLPLATRAARDLLARLAPRDEVALVNTSTLPNVQLAFTTSRAVLARALDRLRGQQDAERAFGWQRARQGLGVLEALLTELRTEATGARRVPLVLFSEGYDLEPAAQRGQVDVDILRDVRTVVGLAAQANVAIYAIDPAGLSMETSFVPPATGARPVGPAARLRRGGVSSSLSAIADLSALAALAHDTGGRLTRRSNDLLDQVPAMLADGDEYYLVTYEMPEVSGRDRRGSVPAARQLDVRVRRPGLTVRARQSYVHPAVLASR